MRTDHCALCDHQQLSLKGSTCALTNEKPDFNATCPTIKLDESFEETLKAINIECERIRKTKVWAYINFTVFFAISLGVMIGGYLLGKYILESGVISTLPIIIMGLGFLLLPLSIGPLTTYLQNNAAAQKKRDHVHEILALYNIEYEIEMKFEKEIHGIQEVQADLIVKGLP